MVPGEPPLYRGLRARIEALLPGAVVESIRAIGLSAGAGAGDGDEKRIGYGETLQAAVRTRDGARADLVFHTATDNLFGHDRRADRARSMLLDYDTFNTIPLHVRAVDVGAICGDGSLTTLAGCGEVYVITEFAEGTEYAADLRRVARARRLEEGDRARAGELARYLAGLHRREVERRPERYTRSVRDLVGDGEGIFGIVDGYPEKVPAAPPERLRAIEERCAGWRWRLRGKEQRLARIHGDFHPFNILFGPDGRLALLDASRGSAGDPADDVTCLAVNFVFFALDNPGSWPALGELSRIFWTTYLEESRDRELLEVAPPYFAWRSLVLANPRWYPALAPASRDALLSLCEEALAAGRLDPERAGRVLR